MLFKLMYRDFTLFTTVCGELRLSTKFYGGLLLNKKLRENYLGVVNLMLKRNN